MLTLNEPVSFSGTGSFLYMQEVIYIYGMKYFLLISVLFITNITYAQLPGVIGKDKAIMDAYCDTLMAKLHLTKKVKETQHVFILRDKDKHNIIRG